MESLTLLIKYHFITLRKKNFFPNFRVFKVKTFDEKYFFDLELKRSPRRKFSGRYFNV